MQSNGEIHREPPAATYRKLYKWTGVLWVGTTPAKTELLWLCTGNLWKGRGYKYWAGQYTRVTTKLRLFARQRSVVHLVLQTRNQPRNSGCLAEKLIAFYTSLVWFWINAQWIGTEGNSSDQLLWLLGICRLIRWAKQKYSIVRGTKEQVLSPPRGNHETTSGQTGLWIYNRLIANMVSYLNFTSIFTLDVFA